MEADLKRRAIRITRGVMKGSRSWYGFEGQPRRAGAVIFDLDGTLTRPYFDFDAIRREMGLPTEPRTPILESLEQMPPEQRARAEDILDAHEERAARESELWDDAPAVLAAIGQQAIPIGLLTRNSRRSVEVLLARHAITFDVVQTREDGPLKPSPEPVRAMCRHLGVPAASAWVVGDHPFDLQAGNAAGATTVLMIGDGPSPDFTDQADHVIRRLSELLPLLSIPPAT
jgi:HAD superfamily hydrolase (TIGR01549 family)